MQTDVLEHPAVKAWMRLQPDSIEPEGIEVLDRKKRAWIKFRSELVQPEDIEILQEKRLIYRLKGVGPEGSALLSPNSARRAMECCNTLCTKNPFPPTHSNYMLLWQWQ